METDKKRILVIDDDQTVLEVLKQGLENFGYNVNIAISSGEAMTEFNKEKPDAILLDVRMPDQDGITFCRNIKVSREADNIPILIITAFNDVNSRNDAILFGACDFILKPFEMDTIKDKIEEAISKFKKKKDEKK